MRMVWEQQRNKRNIVFTGGYKKNTRYLKFLNFFSKLTAAATFVVVVKVLVMVFGV